MSKPIPKSDAFTNLARSLECDEDEAHWEDRLRKVARQKPTDEPPASEPAPGASK